MSVKISDDSMQILVTGPNTGKCFVVMNVLAMEISEKVASSLCVDHPVHPFWCLS